MCVYVHHLQNKVFIFRGHEFEKLAEFNARLYSIFPNARFMKTLETPGLNIMESPDQCILETWDWDSQGVEHVGGAVGRWSM